MAKLRISLEKKAILVPVLVLIPIALVSLWLLHQHLMQSLETSRSRVAARYAKEVVSMLADSSQQMQGLAELIPMLDGLRPALRSGDHDSLQRSFEDAWQLVQLSHEVVLLNLFDANGELLAGWSLAPLSDQVGQEVPAWVALVNREERPLTKVRCDEECLHLVLVPLLVDGKRSGVLMLASSLAQSVINLQQTSGKDIGLLAPYQVSTSARVGETLPNWGMRVLALSRFEQRIELMQQLAQQFPLSSSGNKALRSIHQDRNYEVLLIPLDEMKEAAHSFLFVIDDITADYQAIDRFKRGMVAGGLATLLLAAAGMYWLLTGPKKQIMRLNRVLPMLVERDFTAAQGLLSQDMGAWTRDEFDQLEETALQVTQELQVLHETLHEKNRALALRLQELEAERGFAQSLLDTAQAIILTLDRHGELLTINQFGEDLSGYSLESLRSGAFSRLFGHSRSAQTMGEMFHPLLTGSVQSMRHEANLLTQGGEERAISWVHARNKGRYSHQAEIISVGLDVTRSRQMESQVQWLVDHDPLTQLPSRRRFEEELEHFLRSPTVSEGQAALLIVDVDDFRDFNQTLGSEVGDTLLQRVAEKLRELIRESGTVARLGGDNFALLLRRAGREEAIQFAEQIAKRAAEIRLVRMQVGYQVTVGVGIALIPEHGVEVNEVMANGEAAKDQAKALGKGRWQFHSAQEHKLQEAEQRLYWRGRIDQALREKRFRLYFQPMLDIASNQVHHYEALLRMLDEKGDVVAPGYFIPIAERSGQIRDLERFVLEEAVANQAGFARLGKEVSLSVNLSAHSFRDLELPKLLEDTIQRYGADPRRLIFELTETAALADMHRAREMMGRIRAQGCQFALDDFGVGFTSFNYMRELPVDYVKIDGSFIRGLVNDLPNQRVVQALKMVASGFGMATIAEFVDNPGALELLREYGVDMAQGYLIGKPQPCLLDGTCL